MKHFVRLSIIAALAFVLAFTGKEAGLFAASESDEVEHLKSNSGRLTDYDESKGTLESFNSLCLSGSDSSAPTSVQVCSGNTANSLRQNRKWFELKGVNGFVPFLKNGSICGMFTTGDIEIGDPHFPSHSFKADDCLTILRKLRL